MTPTADLRIRARLAFAVLFLCAACGGGGSDGGASQPKLSGTIFFLPGSSSVPSPASTSTRHTSSGFNRSVDRAQPIGSLRAGASVEIAGTLAAGSGEVQGFTFVAPDRVAVRAVLSGEAASGAELLVYDPVALQYVARGVDGEATFLAQGSADVVVRGSESGGAYTLVLSARSDAIAEIGADPSPPVYLGHLSIGDTIDSAVDGARASPQRMLVTAVEDLVVDVQCAGAEIRVDDVTLAPRAARAGGSATSSGGIDPSSSADRAASGGAGVPASSTAVMSASGSAGSTASNPSTHELEVPACTLIEIEVRPMSATASQLPGSLALRIGARAPTHASIVSRAMSGSIAALERERELDPRAEVGGFYGAPRAEFVAGQVLVAPKPGLDLEADISHRGARAIDAIPGGARLLTLDLANGMQPAERARATIAASNSFKSSARVLYSELNIVRHACGVPNDTYYPLQWHYPLIHLPEAWDITTGSDNVIVAIIDTGQTNHPDLVNRQIAGYDFISEASNAGDGDGIDADPTDVGDGTGPQPSSFHGTHVAGTVGAETNNGTGVAGVTWATKLMHLRVLGKHGGNDFDIANAVRYAARLSNNSQTLPPQRANVVNMSLGGPDSTQTMQNAVIDARNQGVVIFAAAGNEDTSEASFPGVYDGVISVAAVDINAHRAPYSNFGPSIDLCAPGGNSAADLDHDGHPDGVLSTLMDDSTNPFTPVYAFYDGTSMATPHASGVAALMLAVNPALTPAEIESILESTATDLGTPGRDDLYGHGLINAYAAVSMALGGGGPSHPVLSLSLTSLSFGTQQTDLSTAVMNIGNGMLDVTGVTVMTSSGGNWLSATTVPSGDPSTNVSAVNVHVDRTGLADALYVGSVKVTSSNGGDQTIQVTMVVQNVVSSQDIDLFLLAVDADTFEPKGQVTVNPSTGLNWALFDLPPGNYILVCGSDDDHDDVICGNGDTYCGLYPTLNDPEPVGLGTNPIGSLDFTVSSQPTAAAALDRARWLRAIRAKGVSLLH